MTHRVSGKHRTGGCGARFWGGVLVVGVLVAAVAYIFLVS